MTVFGICITKKEIENWVEDNISIDENVFDEFEALMESYSFDVVRTNRGFYVGRIVDVVEEDDREIIESEENIDLDEEYLERLFPMHIIKLYSDIREW